MRLHLETIKSAAAAEWINWRYHAVLRFRERGITREQVKRVLQEGHILEQHPTDKPFPKCLMMAMIEPSRPLHHNRPLARPQQVGRPVDTQIENILTRISHRQRIPNTASLPVPPANAKVT